MSVPSITRRLYVTAFLAAVVSSFGTPAALADHDKSLQQKPRLGMDGYCPVCVIEARTWEMGSKDITSTYDGFVYRFPSEAIKRKFDQSPARYVPALGGDCIVCYEKAEKRVPGSVRFASLFENRLYLFPSDKERQMFKASPEAFAKTDLAANGECVVCLAKAGKHIPGTEKFTEIHNGFRYLFPSAAEQAEFRRKPAEYAQSGMMKKEGRQVSRASRDSASTRVVTVAGRSGCAACEHGVTPLSSPDELGLAVNTEDGRVVVVEGAHELYPEVYASRFEGRSVQVKGTIVKTDGQVSWLKPSDLRVLN